MSEDSLEAPQADAAEQQQAADPAADTGTGDAPDVPLEADEADAAEQARPVAADGDEDYR